MKDQVFAKHFKLIFSILAGLFVIISTFGLIFNPSQFLSFGYLGIFAYNVFGSGLLLLPLLKDQYPLSLIVIICALGNIFNTSVNYYLGSQSSSMFSKVELISKLKKWMLKFETLAVYLLSMAPFPLDLNALLSGYLGISYPKYILVNFLGKITLFSIVGLGILKFAEAFS